MQMKNKPKFSFFDAHMNIKKAIDDKDVEINKELMSDIYTGL